MDYQNPFLRGWANSERAEQHGQLAQLQKMQGVLGIQNAIAQQQVAQEERQRQVVLRDALANSPELQNHPLLRALAQNGNAGAVLPYVLPKPQGETKVGPGETLLGPDRKPIYTAPFAPKDPRESPLAIMTRERDALPPGDPRRATYDAAIHKATTNSPAVNVNLTPPMAGVDAQGNPVFFQAPKGGGTPQIVPGIRPPVAGKETDGLTAENAAKVAMSQQAIQGIDVVRSKIFTPDGRLQRGMLAAIHTPGSAGLPGNEDARIAFSAIKSAVEAKLRLETGAAAPELEVERIARRYMPTPFDTKGSAEYKLNDLQNFFKGSLSQTKGVRPITPNRRDSDRNNDPLGIR